MTTIYIPRKITSAEEAEALPEGTPAYRNRRDRIRSVAVRGSDLWGEMTALWAVDGIYRTANDVIGYTALVPTVVDRVDSQPLCRSHHRAEQIDRHPFTVYIDYQETP